MAKTSLDISASNIARLEGTVKDYKTMTEKMQKEINKLMMKKMNLQTDLENANAEVEKLEKQMAEKDKQMRALRGELNR